ncbi:uncharacterized protein LOC114245718 [Bombyx mandarina]|uniref:Uncharacterized protein LOC114245718 n=1 Tax=Bombyx mandarina TaxID=7092 RepID=A0A6J2JWJ6_BOMMA|nr:uncharacterized protein LOC114245718 [Bombyx mandarina]
MILYQNFEIIVSLLFYFVVKIVCSLKGYKVKSMHYKRKAALTSIPEDQENEDDNLHKKWVPKKKHEVLKAKYKCLKKLFQIYDASVIGILPEATQEEETIRKKRSFRTKTDACAGTAETTNGDELIEADKESVATAVMRDLKMTQCSLVNFDSKSTIPKIDKCTTRSVDNIVLDKEYVPHTEEPLRAVPYLIQEPRKPTRFQCFVQRLFGIRSDKLYANYVTPSGHIYAASDNNISHNYYEKRRRKGFQFRRLRRPKKIQSDGALRSARDPIILNFVQSVQRSCLMDTTARQCPIVGCKMMFYGIINYNDHLNLCHFADRKFVCHYCHEGFERERDKCVHENEHIGITKLGASKDCPTPESLKIASDTQTDPSLTQCDFPDEKLKKLVSFFDKIIDPEKVLTDIGKGRCSECNLESNRSKTVTLDTTADCSDASDKKTVSCVNLPRRGAGRWSSLSGSEATSKSPFGAGAVCQICGENFDCRRQLSLHVDLEHRVHDKFSKFHSCAGIINYRPRVNRIDVVSEDGKINVQTVGKRQSYVTSADTSLTAVSEASEDSVSCAPSASVHTRVLGQKKSPRKGPNYKWTPENQIVRS